jgi:hypothetical protein
VTAGIDLGPGRPSLGGPRFPWERRLGHVGDGVALVLAGVWIVCLVRVAAHRIFVTLDSLIDYAHVWYVAERLWHGHGLAYRMPIVSHGDGLAFPYGSVPWLSAALLHPVLGDRAVTFALVAGGIALVATTFVAFPELGRSWWAVAVLLNPALISGVLNGQLPFLWGASFFMVAVAAWRRDRRRTAVVLAALAQITHPAVLIPIAAVTVALRLPWERARRPLVVGYLVSLAVSVPAVVVLLQSSVFTEASIGARIASFADTVLPRCEFLLIPVLLMLGRKLRPEAAMGAFLALAAAVTLAIGWGYLRTPYAWRGMSRSPDTAIADWTRSPAFVPGATYRAMGFGDSRVGLYRLLQAGGRIDSDFFPESQLRRSWSDPGAYSTSLREREVDVVLIAPGYDATDHVNEVALLASMAAHPPPTCGGPEVCVHAIEGGRGFLAYRIDRG